MLRKPYWVTAGFLLAAVVVFLLIRIIVANRRLDAAIAASASPQAAQQMASAKPSSPVRISAAKLYSEFDQNAVAANDEFGGRTLEVTGKVLNSERESDGILHVRIGVDGLNDVDAQISKSSDVTVAQLKKGHSVTLVCTDVHRALGSVTLDRCTIPPVD
ncbi:MAG TPA: hypothetical protein VJS11_05685 [Acidobacteriaceae bacterium]|nr:hypothetical protein [Acidobacteriaceae bacterium]